MPVDAFSTLPHYATHLAPIFAALPMEQRGIFWAAGAWGDMPDHLGVGRRAISYPQAARGMIVPTMVAGYQDEVDAGRVANRSIIYVEHGAGQAYGGSPDGFEFASYSGSPGHDKVVLFICPNQLVADRWTAKYPGVRTAVVGCPKLDYWHSRPVIRHEGRPVAAITFHADNRLCPETITAWTHYEHGLRRVVGQLYAAGIDVIGHGHPRLWQKLRRFWQSIGVEAVEDFNEVLLRADLLAVDNSSTGPEFASTGRPIVWMNAPWFRRDVHHGGRFWDWTEGMPVADGPESLAQTIIDAMADPPNYREARERMVSSVYVACDGKASERAADAIMDLVAPKPVVQEDAGMWSVPEMDPEAEHTGWNV